MSSESGEKRAGPEAVEESVAKRTKVEDPAPGSSEAAAKPKKSKKKSLRAKYDALEAEIDEPESEAKSSEALKDAEASKPPSKEFVKETKVPASEPTKEPDVGEESDEDGEFEDYGSDDDEEEEEEDDDDDDDEEEVSGDEVEEDVDELSEPDIEPGSRRRRQPVDYAKVLAEVEAEEKAKKAQKE